MKRIITIAIALAVTIPTVMVAQTPDYYGYDNEDKTVLVEWVAAAIDNGYIDFDTQTHETAFLALVDSLYAKRTAQDWSGCVTVAGYLETAAQYIDGSADETLVTSLCDCTEEVYTEIQYPMSITPADMSDIQDALVNNGGGTATTDTYHTADCDDIYIGSSFVHSKGCGTLTSVQL